MELAGRTPLTMEFSDHQGGDRLLVGGRLIGNDNTMRMVFVGAEAPGLDQIFDFLSVGAGAAENLQIAGPDGVRQLSVSIAVLFCRQRDPGQPGLADRGRIVTPRGLRTAPVCGNRRRLRHGYPVQTLVAGEGLDELQRRRVSGVKGSL
jgi:hypothetical protein